MFKEEKQNHTKPIECYDCDKYPNCENCKYKKMKHDKPFKEVPDDEQIMYD